VAERPASGCASQPGPGQEQEEALHALALLLSLDQDGGTSQSAISPAQASSQRPRAQGSFLAAWWPRGLVTSLQAPCDVTAGPMWSPTSAHMDKFVIAGAAGRRGVAVRAAPDDRAKRLGRATCGQVVAALSSEQSRPGWLQIQWLAVRGAF
jgi:hypothetical protein